MDTDRPRGVPLVTVWELLLYIVLIGTSGAITSFYVGPLLALDLAGPANQISAVIDHLGAANVHLLALGGVLSLRSRGREFASSRLLRRVLVLGALVIGIMTAVSASRLHPAAPTVGWIIIGFYAAVGPVFVAGLLPPPRTHDADRDGSGGSETITAALGNADAAR